MPYEIKKYKYGFRVCKKDDPNKCFSNKPLTKKNAIKQMQAIAISEHKKGAGDVWNKKIKIDGFNFVIKKSNRKNKKYDVFFDNEYLLSFGDSRYDHYFDKLGQYEDLNHLDDKRKESYYKRHGETDDITSSKYWSNKYLWGNKRKLY